MGASMTPSTRSHQREPEELLRLAELCEKATGPDRELDMLIDCGLKGIEVVYPTEGHPMTGRGGRIEAKNTYELLGWIDPGEVNRNFSPYGGEDRYPAVTASLDAAMSLVPEGWGPALDNVMPEKLPFAELWHREVKHDEGGMPHQERKTGTAATLPLALCAAALRARASTPPEGHKPITSEDHHE
jgi:hypothetical protein